MENINQTIDGNMEGTARSMVTDYVINVKTSDRFGAGTDAAVFVRLLGDRDPDGRLEPLALKNSQHLNKFERHSLDQFTFCDQISRGKLEKIKIWHDDTGLGSSWHLEFVEVCDIGAQLKYRFPCHRWLSSTKDDQQICRTLRCTEVSAGPKQTVQVATGQLKPGLTNTSRFKKSSLASLISRPSPGQHSKRNDSDPILVSSYSKSRKTTLTSSSDDKIAASIRKSPSPPTSGQISPDEEPSSSSSPTLDRSLSDEKSDIVAKLRELSFNNRTTTGKFPPIEPSSSKIEVFSARPTTVYGQFTVVHGHRQESTVAGAVGFKVVDKNTLGQKQSSKSSLYGPFSSR